MRCLELCFITPVCDMCIGATKLDHLGDIRNSLLGCDQQTFDRLGIEWLPNSSSSSSSSYILDQNGNVFRCKVFQL